MFLRNCWYAAAWSAEIRHSLMPRTICDEAVVLFRASTGEVVSLEDRCCHRQLPLSRGKLLGDLLQCGYHGLEFDATGRCLKIPAQDSISEHVRVRTFPVVERHDLVWIWLGEPALATPESVPALPHMGDPAWAGSGGNVLRIDCDYNLLNDNLLDLSHGTFVHASTVGTDDFAGTIARTRVDGNRVVCDRQVESFKTSEFWRKNLEAVGYAGNVDYWQRLVFEPPSFYTLSSGMFAPGAGAGADDAARSLLQMVFYSLNTPETETSCWQFWVFLRNFRIEDRSLNEHYRSYVESFLTEDVDLLNAQQRSIDARRDARQCNIVHDAGGVAARRLLASMMAS